jgi:hypothetical protein
MPWGKHRGEPLSEIEASYLLWVLEKADGLTIRLRTAIEHELSRRFPPPATENGQPVLLPAEIHPVAEKLIKAGFRQLAHEAHPDHGGSDAEMRCVLAAFELLRTRFKVTA